MAADVMEKEEVKNEEEYILQITNTASTERRIQSTLFVKTKRSRDML
jgi:hypothetical protein